MNPTKPARDNQAATTTAPHSAMFEEIETPNQAKPPLPPTVEILRTPRAKVPFNLDDEKNWLTRDDFLHTPDPLGNAEVHNLNPFEDLCPILSVNNQRVILAYDLYCLIEPPVMYHEWLRLTITKHCTYSGEIEYDEVYMLHHNFKEPRVVFYMSTAIEIMLDSETAYGRYIFSICCDGLEESQKSKDTSASPKTNHATTSKK